MVAVFWLIGVLLSLSLGISADLGWLYLFIAVIAGGWQVRQALDFVCHPTAKRGDMLFYQSANYRAVLFVAIIVDVLLKTILPISSGL